MSYYFWNMVWCCHSSIHQMYLCVWLINRGAAQLYICDPNKTVDRSIIYPKFVMLWYQITIRHMSGHMKRLNAWKKVQYDRYRESVMHMRRQMSSFSAIFFSKFYMYFIVLNYHSNIHLICNLVMIGTSVNIKCTIEKNSDIVRHRPTSLTSSITYWDHMNCPVAILFLLWRHFKYIINYTLTILFQHNSSNQNMCTI